MDIISSIYVFSALCCGCHGAFGSGQIKCTCCSPSAALPFQNRSRSVGRFSLPGERHLVINREPVCSESRFFFFALPKFYKRLLSVWHFRTCLILAAVFFGTWNLSPFRHVCQAWKRGRSDLKGRSNHSGRLIAEVAGVFQDPFHFQGGGPRNMSNREFHAS